MGPAILLHLGGPVSLWRRLPPGRPGPESPPTVAHLGLPDCCCVLSPSPHLAVPPSRGFSAGLGLTPVSRGTLRPLLCPTLTSESTGDWLIPAAQGSERGKVWHHRAPEIGGPGGAEVQGGPCASHSLVSSPNSRREQRKQGSSCPARVRAPQSPTAASCTGSRLDLKDQKKGQAHLPEGMNAGQGLPWGQATGYSSPIWLSSCRAEAILEGTGRGLKKHHSPHS